MLASLPEQQRAGLGGVPVPAIIFVDGKANVAADVGFLVVPDPQVAMANDRAVGQADIKIIGWQPLDRRLCLSGPYQAEVDFIEVRSSASWKIKDVSALVFMCVSLHIGGFRTLYHYTQSDTGCIAVVSCMSGCVAIVTLRNF